MSGEPAAGSAGAPVPALLRWAAAAAAGLMRRLTCSRVGTHRSPAAASVDGPRCVLPFRPAFECSAMCCQRKLLVAHAHNNIGDEVMSRAWLVFVIIINSREKTHMRLDNGLTLSLIPLYD